MRLWLLSAAVLIVGCAAPVSVTTESAPSISAPSATQRITIENYQALKLGMTYAELVALLGDEGSRESFGNLVWYASSDRFIWVKLENDRLVDKGQSLDHTFRDDFQAAPVTASTPFPLSSPTGSQSCGAGMIWVDPYYRQDGTHVKGYCRRK